MHEQSILEIRNMIIGINNRDAESLYVPFPEALNKDPSASLITPEISDSEPEIVGAGDAKRCGFRLKGGVERIDLSSGRV